MEIRVGYKKTECGVIPQAWKCKMVGEFVDNTKLGGNYANDTRPSQYPLIKMGNIGRGNIVLGKIEYVKNIIPCDADKLKYGDLLFNTRNTLELVGKVAVWRDELPMAYYNSNLLRFVFKKQYIATNFFMNYMLNSKLMINKLRDIATGTTSVAAIYSRDLFGITIPIPPLPEQQAIATALSDIDGLINSLTKLIDKKKNIKQGAMQELLTGKKRLEGFSGEWEVRVLGDILEIGHGKSQHSIVDINGKYPILATGGEIGRTNSYLYDKPSVLIGRKGTIDEPQYMDTPFWTIDTLFYTKIHEDINPKYLYYVFCSIAWILYNEASGVPSLSARTIESIEIFIPFIAEQIAIADIISDMDIEIDALEQKLKKHKDIKQGMMQELLTGRIRLLGEVV